MSNFKWQCPFCNHFTTILDSNYQENLIDHTTENADGARRLKIEFIVCPNPECNKFTLTVNLNKLRKAPLEWILGKFLQTWDLIPSSKAKVFPNYVPMPILNDYNEACLIKDLSPKASATLSRRCLQGIIRDFWKIKKPRLVDEIEEIKDKVDPLTWQAIEAVRKVGNIGAHMEKDINLIIEVEPEEANKLIELIELLISEWYVNKHERKENLKTIVGISEAKEEEKNN